MSVGRLWHRADCGVADESIDDVRSRTSARTQSFSKDVAARREIILKF